MTRMTAVALATVAVLGNVRAEQPALAGAIEKLSRASVWTLERSVPLTFRAYHPQGMVKIGDRLFVSSVEVKVPTRRSEKRSDGFDRDPGEGVGHLFEVTMAGALVADQILGEGTMYHPGGIDFDGTHIWVTVAEYRPNSRSIVYRIDPATRTATEVFRFADHLGAIVRNTDDNTLHAVSWGSRWFYRFALDANGSAKSPPAAVRTANPSHYVDYQDCKYVGARRMVCTGIADVPGPAGAAPIQLGGVDLIDVVAGQPVHQVPVGLLTPKVVSLTRNPSFFEATATGLRAFFLPEDDTATVYVYRIEP